MKQFFAVFRVPLATMEQYRAETSPEEMRKQGEEMMRNWTAWAEAHKANIVEGGWPLGTTKTVTAAGVADGRNDLNYAMIVEAESHDAATKIFSDNPHLQIPTSSIDVMEISHMGM